MRWHPAVRSTVRYVLAMSLLAASVAVPSRLAISMGLLFMATATWMIEVEDRMGGR